MNYNNDRNDTTVNNNLLHTKLLNISTICDQVCKNQTKLKSILLHKIIATLKKYVSMHGSVAQIIGLAIGISLYWLDFCISVSDRYRYQIISRYDIITGQSQCIMN